LAVAIYLSKLATIALAGAGGAIAAALATGADGVASFFGALDF